MNQYYNGEADSVRAHAMIKCACERGGACDCVSVRTSTQSSRTPLPSLTCLSSNCTSPCALVCVDVYVCVYLSLFKMCHLLTLHYHFLHVTVSICFFGVGKLNSPSYLLLTYVVARLLAS